MAGTTVESSGYWLPSEFFDDVVPARQNRPATVTRIAGSGSEFHFPAEFPYQINPGERFNEKRRVMSTSPHSKLARMWGFPGRIGGGANGVTSPPNSAVEDLVYLAAKLNLNGGDALGPATNSGLTKWADQIYPTAGKPSPSVFHGVHRKQGCGVQCSEPQLCRGWPVQQTPARVGRPGSRAALLAGSGGGSPGTGVFLPQRYGNIKNGCNNSYPSDSRKGAGYAAATAAYIPGRNLHALTLNQPKLNPGFVSEYDVLVARRNALLLQRRRSLLLEGSSGVCLPQEWNY